MNGTQSEILDFDIPIDRTGTLSTKWDKYKGRDVIPLWIADMDFRSPSAIIEALRRRVDHGVFGYGTLKPEELVDGIVSKLEAVYGWAVDREWLVFMPGVATGFSAACEIAGEEGDDVVTAVPVYPPFLFAPERAHRRLTTVALAEEHGRWSFDFNKLESCITPRTSMFMLCNPHNPVGRVFERDELLTLSEICAKRDLIICSDEIHCDLILDPEKRHIPIASLAPEVADRTITLMSPSKTFNLAGLGFSFGIISNPEIRRRFCAVMPRPGGIVPIVSVLAYTAAIVAYHNPGCDRWLTALLSHLRENRDILSRAIDRMPGLSMTHAEATFLAWIDTRKSGLQDPAAFFEDAGLGLSDGLPFGGGPGFVRFNFACTRRILETAISRMSKAMGCHHQES